MSLSDQPVSCWLCREPMDESKEHVLPESITYRASLQVSGFICTRCNNTTGTEWDAALAAVCRPAFRADQNYPSHLRETGPRFTPAEFITFDGDVVVGTVDRDGNFRPNPERPEVKDMGDGSKRVSVHGAADDRRIYEQMEIQQKRFNHIESGVRDEELVEGIPSQEITIDWRRIRKALVKSYMALAYHVGIDPFICNMAIPFLRNEAVSFQGHEMEGVFVLESPRVMVHERAARYNHITLIYSAGECLFGGAHISGFPLGFTRGEYLNKELHVETMVPALLSTQYDGPPLMKAYMVNLGDRKHRVLDMRCLLANGTIKWIVEADK